MPHCVMCNQLEQEPRSHKPSDFKILAFYKGRYYCKAPRNCLNEGTRREGRRIDYSKLRSETVTVEVPVEGRDGIMPGDQGTVISTPDGKVSIDWGRLKVEPDKKEEGKTNV